MYLTLYCKCNTITVIVVTYLSIVSDILCCCIFIIFFRSFVFLVFPHKKTQWRRYSRQYDEYNKPFRHKGKSCFVLRKRRIEKQNTFCCCVHSLKKTCCVVEYKPKKCFMKGHVGVYSVMINDGYREVAGLIWCLELESCGYSTENTFNTEG